MDVQALGAISLADNEGARHELRTYWAARPVVVAFLRHFG